MKKLNEKVEELASGSGDLTKEVDIYSGDELEVIAGNMNKFIDQIRSLVKEVAQSTQDILVNGEELNTTVNENTRIMSDMSSEIGQISVNMEHSSASSKELSAELIETDGEQVGAEGCLSVPGKYGLVKRPYYAKVRAQDRYGEWYEAEGEELIGRCFCHELDHLDGIIYTEVMERFLTEEELMADDEE